MIGLIIGVVAVAILVCVALVLAGIYAIYSAGNWMQ